MTRCKDKQIWTNTQCWSWRQTCKHTDTDGTNHGIGVGKHSSGSSIA